MKASENLLPAAKKIRKVKKSFKGKKEFCAAKLDPAENFALQKPIRQGQFEPP
jgi:hypothetical protein